MERGPKTTQKEAPNNVSHIECINGEKKKKKKEKDGEWVSPIAALVVDGLPLSLTMLAEKWATLTYIPKKQKRRKKTKQAEA